MSQPLVATSRISIPYIVDGENHIARVYVVKSGSSVPYGVVLSDASTISFADAAQGVWDAMQFAFSDNGTQVSVPTAVLESLVGSAWLPLEFAVLTGHGRSGGEDYHARQTTLVYRDTSYKKVKIVLMEGRFRDPEHVVAPSNSTSNLNGLLGAFAGFQTITNDPTEFVVGRSENYLLGTSGAVGATVALNRKIRRRRGLA